MVTYKITNITNLLGKRESKFNSTLDVEYVDGMTKKTTTIKPGSSLFLTIPTLPLSVHRLRVKGLVSVLEVTGNELKNLNAVPEPKTKKKTETTEKKHAADDTLKKSTKKKTGKKESELIVDEE